MGNLLLAKKPKQNRMTKPQLNHKFNFRIVPKYGDLPLFLSLFEGRWLRRLIQGDKTAGWTLLADYTYLQMGIFSHAITAVFRYRHGAQTMGFLMILFTLSWVAVLNYNAIEPALRPFAWGAAFFMPFYKSPPELYDLIFSQIHSKALLIYGGIYLSAALVHTSMIYAGHGNQEATKRGDSWLYNALLKRTGLVSEQVVQIIIEPLLAFLTGWLFWVMGDRTFSTFLWIGAASLFIQEVLDEAHAQKTNTLV